MKETTITVTQASGNFADCINRVHYQNRQFVLVKNGRRLARLVPEIVKVCTGRELAESLAQVELPPAAALAWRKKYSNQRGENSHVNFQQH